MWIDTVTDDIYRCTDDTVGAAVWIGTTLEVTDLGALATKNTIGTTDIDNGAVTATKLAAGAAVPTQTGQTGKFLKTDGTNATWATVDLSTKVDKVSGKALSANDFTNTLKNKLDGVAASANNYSHPTNHAISVITGLQTALDAKVDDSQVLTNVPTGALFTDTNTTYSVGDGGLTQKNFTTADNTKLDGIATSANNYTHPATHPASMLTGALPAIDGSNLTGLVASFSGLSDTTVSASDPTVSTNPPAVGHLWINSTSGAQFVATSITAGDNVWTNTGDGSGAIEAPYTADFLVVAGGGSSSGDIAGGGGAGGLRTSYGSTSGGGTSAESSITITPGNTYTITVGGGASGTNWSAAIGAKGANSQIQGSGISTITSTGGGGGVVNSTGSSVKNGGSGGGTRYNYGAGSGVSGQGFGGGRGTSYQASAGGGGGASQAGYNALGNQTGGNGGSGLAVSITGQSVTYAGGGAAGGHGTIGAGGGTGGAGGGGNGGGSGTSMTSGSANTGGGGGGNNVNVNPGGNGGSGVVILRIPATKYTGNTTGSPSVSTSGSYKVLKYTSSGTYTG